MAVLLPAAFLDERATRHLAAHKLFLQFTNVVILREQVRAAGCPRLRAFLQRLRSGEQTELDFQRLCQRLYTPSSRTSFVDGLRAITPLNLDRWDLNMAAVVQWARAHGKHISIFVSKHDTEARKQLDMEQLSDKPARGDFIEPKNVLDSDMRAAVVKLERLGDETRRRFERDHRHETWFQEWDAMPESAQAIEVTDEEEASLWCDT